MIKELTKEQEGQFQYYVDKWLDIGLSTEPLDLEGAKEGARLSYKIAGLTCPENFYSFPSPMSAVIGINMMHNGYKIPDSVNLLEYVETLPVKDYKIIMNYSELNIHLRGMIYGSQDAGWLSFYNFFSEKFPKIIEPLTKGLENIAQTCGWWSPYKKAVVFQDRPEVINFDENEVLHCENGPAILFRDGFSIYAWRGVTVPKEWIEDPNYLTPKIALDIVDAEQRRCACEILGWDKVLEDESLNPKVINEDLPNIGTLIQVDLPDAPEQWFLKYQCGTGRWFAEAVNDKSFNTALKANAGGNGWRGQGDPMSFIPFIRT